MMAKKTELYVTAQDVRMALRTKYAPPAWTLFHEVSNKAGFDRNRSADAIAMSIWPSRGLTLHGFEVKVSRGDWLRELKRPDKADPIVKYCDYWWLAIGNERVISGLAEVPETWGVLSLTGKKLVVLRDAPKLEPIGIDRSFLACLLRAANEQGAVEPLLKKHYDEGYKAGQEERERRIGYQAKSWEEKFEQLRDRVNEFEQASGVSIDAFRHYTWDRPKKIGEAVRIVLAGGTEQYADRLRDLLDTNRRIGIDLEKAINAMNSEPASVSSEDEP